MGMLLAIVFSLFALYVVVMTFVSFFKFISFDGEGGFERRTAKFEDFVVFSVMAILTSLIAVGLGIAANAVSQ